MPGDTPPIPGPRPAPLIGNLLELVRSGLLPSVLRRWREHGDLFRYELGGRSLIVVIHPDHLQQVLVKQRNNYIKGASFDSMVPLVGRGLLTADGDLWQAQRRRMQPHFTPAAARTHARAVSGELERMLGRLAGAASRGPVDVQSELIRFTMATICRTMFGAEVDGTEALGAALTTAMHWVGTRQTRLVRLPLAIPTPTNRGFTRALAVIDGFLRRVVHARVRRGPPSGDPDLLDALLQATDERAGAAMSQQELRDEVVTLFVAGHETTEVALGWTLHLLAQHREAQDELRAEVERVVGGRLPEVADLAGLDATRRAIDEAMRLFPPVWLIARQAVDEAELGGRRVPRGAVLLPCFYATHRHPEHWQDPERFDPGRFAGRPGLHPFAYLPFGAGPRVCIGQSFALQEMVLTIAALVQRFEFSLAPGALFGLDPGAGVLRSREPLRLLLRPRGNP